MYTSNGPRHTTRTIIKYFRMTYTLQVAMIYDYSFTIRRHCHHHLSFRCVGCRLSLSWSSSYKCQQPSVVVGALYQIESLFSVYSCLGIQFHLLNSKAVASFLLTITAVTLCSNNEQFHIKYIYVCMHTRYNIK